uniref:Uncharacterized protein n=1 Tax=Oryza brachyantha TaxID=4533 RepID=J3NC20_ORYBR
MQRRALPSPQVPSPLAAAVATPGPVPSGGGDCFTPPRWRALLSAARERGGLPEGGEEEEEEGKEEGQRQPHLETKPTPPMPMVSAASVPPRATERCDALTLPPSVRCAMSNASRS